MIALKVNGKIKHLSGSSGDDFREKNQSWDENDYRRVVGEHVGADQHCDIDVIAKPAQRDMRTSKSAILQKWSQLDHPNIVRLVEVVQDREHLYLLTEPCFLTLSDPLSESSAAAIFYQLFAALASAHALGITHGAISPSSVLFAKGNPQIVKLGGFHKAEFGLKTELGFSEIDNATEKGDMWSCGIMLYFVLSRKMPVINDSIWTVTFLEKSWGRVSSEAVSLISSLLNRCPEARPTAAECLNHPWLCPALYPDSMLTKSARASLLSHRFHAELSALQVAIIHAVITRVLADRSVDEAITTLERKTGRALREDELFACVRAALPQRATTVKQFCCRNEVLCGAHLASLFTALRPVTVECLKKEFAIEKLRTADALWRELLCEGELTFAEFQTVVDEIFGS